MPTFHDSAPGSPDSLLKWAADHGVEHVYARFDVQNGEPWLLLGRRGNTPRCRFAALPGVGLRTGADASALRVLVWTKDAQRFAGVSLEGNGPTRRLVMEGIYKTTARTGHPVEHPLRLVVELDERFLQELDVERVFPERPLTIARRDGGFAFPDIPVRKTVLPFVMGHERIEEGTQVRWTVDLIGNLRLSYARPLPSVSSKDWKVVAPPSVGKGRDRNARLAIWPPQHVPKWRGYAVLIGNRGAKPVELLDDSNYRVAFWGCDLVASAPAALGVELGYKRCAEDLAWVEVPEALAARVGPRYVALESADGRSAGAFALLVDSAQVHDGVLHVGLDFGATTTVVAVYDGPEPTAVDPTAATGGVPAMWRPRVAVGEPPERLEVADPWLPTVRSKVLLPEQAYGAEVPSSVLLLGNIDDGQTRPFANAALVCHPLHFNEATDQQLGRLRSELKWRWNASAEDKRAAVAFLTTLLTWVAARYRDRYGGLTVRATYPLAFPEPMRQAYFRMLGEVAAQVERVTGLPVQVAQRGQGTFYDEASVLLLGSGAAYDYPLVYHADLGGSTLDLTVACTNGEIARILAADSVRFGADTVRSVLRGCVSFARAIKDAEERERLIEAALSQAIRNGTAQAAIQGVMEGGGQALRGWREGAALEWAGEAANSVRELRVRGTLYGALAADYCARFLVGALLDEENVDHRLKHAPGLGAAAPPVPPKRAKVFVRLSGNGWKAIVHSSATAWRVESWKQYLQELVDKYAKPTGRHLELKFDSPLPLSKDHTARSVLRIGVGSQVHRGTANVACGPNGFEDGDGGVTAPWFVAVGPGALHDGTRVTAGAKSSVPPKARTWVHTHVAHRKLPFEPRPHTGLPPGILGMLRQSYLQAIENMTVQMGGDEALHAVGRLQAREGAAGQGRVVSSQRALWEAVLTPFLVAVSGDGTRRAGR